MKITSQSLRDGAVIPAAYAFGVVNETHHMRLGPNRNPHLAWSNAPTGTRSLVLLCIDPDAPAKGDEVNQEDKIISADSPRTEFFHWVMVDIPPGVDHIDEGSCCDGVTPGGKQQPEGPTGTRQGINGYTNFLAQDPDMAGTYRGYDGPCPPWNDAIPHRYRFCLYATDLDHCPVDDDFTGPDVVEALQGHVLAEAVITGIYSLNPRVEVE